MIFSRNYLYNIIKYMSVIQSYENTWSCPRCTRYNFSPESDSICTNGCGYSIGDYTYKQFGWKCPQCHLKNSTKMSSSFDCYGCHYKLTLDELQGVVYD